MRVKCIDINDYSYLTAGKIYEVLEVSDEDKYIINNDEPCEYDYEKELFEVVDGEENNTHKQSTKYFHYSFETVDKFGHKNTHAGVVKSENPYFPMKIAEEQLKSRKVDYKYINYNCVIELSKEDFEYKLAELSRFVDDDEGIYG